MVDWRAVFVNFIKLLVAFLFPLTFNLSFMPDGISYGVSAQAYAILGSRGDVSHLRFRWIIERYPISLILALVCVGFAFRLYQKRDKAYPVFSAFVSILVLLMIPLYMLIQFFLMDFFEWSSFVGTLPVEYGFCILLLILFIILPSVSRLPKSSTISSNLSDIEEREQREVKKRIVLTPKISSYLIVIAALILPGLIVLESNVAPEYSSADTFLIAFLFQSGFMSDSMFGYQVANYIQYPMLWRAYGPSIASCLVGLIFAWSVIRYMYGKGSRRIAVLVGAISVIPLVVSALIWQSYSQFWLALPFPLVFVLGLVILRFAAAIQPPEPDQSEIKVPLLFRLKSRLSRQEKDTKDESEHTFSNSEQSD